MGDIVIAILIDLKKAFDTVDHKILLRKLYVYGIRGNMLKWFESYLSNRTQYVVFDGENSDTNSIKCGVPQVSFFGSLLFILSGNAICNVSPLLFKILFADDTCILLSCKNLNTLIDHMNTELIFLNNWFKANNLSLNTKKNTFLMIFHRSRDKSNSIGSIIIDSKELINPRALSATYMLQGIHMHIAKHILNKILQYVCVDILHIQLDLYTERNLLSNIISLSHMSEHISKSELFCNKRNTVKSSTLDQNISILEMSCEYKKNMWM